MTAELDGLVSELQKNLRTMRKVGVEVEKQKKEIITKTVNTIEYCEAAGISKVTLTKRRDKGQIPFVMVDHEYRYYLPKEGGHNGN